MDGITIGREICIFRPSALSYRRFRSFSRNICLFYHFLILVFFSEFQSLMRNVVTIYNKMAYIFARRRESGFTQGLRIIHFNNGGA
jgi:hypothetical protein